MRTYSDESPRENLFAFLSDANISRIKEELGKENIRTIAAILGNIDRVLSTKILASFQPVLQQQIVAAMKSKPQINRQVLHDIAEGLRKRLYSPPAPKKPSPGMVTYGSPELAATIMRYASDEVRKNLHDNDPELFNSLKKLMFKFDDFINTPDRSLQAVFSEANSTQTALALKVAMPNLKKRILSNISPRRADIIKDEMERNQKVGLKDIEQARQNIVDFALEMQRCGKVILDESENVI
jgi:flagellar motor switch protein FliG